MALCRCKELHSRPKGYKLEYVSAKEPIGFPKSSSICGRGKCDKPGLIWLTTEEEKEYQNGVRIFTYASAVSKVQVK
jgi:hypothetical protein